MSQMEIEPEWGTMTLPEPSPLATTPGTETEFQYPQSNDLSNSENPSNQQQDSIPRSHSNTTTTTTVEDEDLYRDLENLENVSDLIRQSSEDDSDNPFYSGKKLLPLITGNDDDTEIDGPDQLPVLDDPLSLTLQVGNPGLEETVPLTRRDRSRSEAGERDAELAGLAFAKHLALQIVSDNSHNITTHQNYHGSGLVREDSLENGLTLVPATPPPTPLSRTSSSSSNISILNPTLSLHTVSEEGHGADEDLGNGEEGEEGEEGGESNNGSGVRSLVSGGSLVINPPTTPMAASTRSNIPFHQLQQQEQPQPQPSLQISILPPSSSAYIVPMTPPTTPQNRTSGTAPASSSTITYQKQTAGFYKPVKPELKQRSGKGASLLTSSASNQGGSGLPPPTPPVTPMNRTGFGQGGRPPPIVANHIGDPAPTPPPTPMSGATNVPIASSLSLRVSTETAPDYMIAEMSPVVGASRSRSSSDITGNTSGGGGLSEIKGHLSNSLLASKFASLSIQTPTSGAGGDEIATPRSGNVIVACRVFDCTGRAFLRGYCAKHWRLAKRTPQEMLDSQDADTEQGVGDEDSKSDLKVDSEPNTPASYEHTLPWLVSSEDGESHWQDWKENLIPASSSGGSGTVVYGSQEFNATNVTIQEYLPQTKTNFECSPVSQLITILAGTFSIRASDGKSKTVTPGNMVLLQDNSGKGHQITVVGSGKHLLSRTLLQATNPTSTATTQ